MNTCTRKCTPIHAHPYTKYQWSVGEARGFRVMDDSLPVPPWTWSCNLVNMSVYAYWYLYALYEQFHAQTHTHVNMHMHMHMFVYVYVCMHVCLYKYAFICKLVANVRGKRFPDHFQWIFDGSQTFCFGHGRSRSDSMDMVLMGWESGDSSVRKLALGSADICADTLKFCCSMSFICSRDDPRLPPPASCLWSHSCEIVYPILRNKAIFFEYDRVNPWIFATRCTRTRTRMHTHMCINIYIWTDIDIYVCWYIYIWMYEYKFTFKLFEWYTYFPHTYSYVATFAHLSCISNNDRVFIWCFDKRIIQNNNGTQRCTQTHADLQQICNSTILLDW